MEYSHTCSPAVLGLKGLSITNDEKVFFKDSNPLGFILFARNCETPHQILKLATALKDLMGRDCPILIDQEGGRVQRLKPPGWKQYSTAQSFGDKFRESHDDALSMVKSETSRIAEDLGAVGVNVNCAPVLDLRYQGAHDIIGDRSYSEDPEIVSTLGAEVCKTYLEAGITPIIKHIPGHGRAKLDSHEDLPVIDHPRQDLERDFIPFKKIAASPYGSDVWAMTAHILYNALDPEWPATLSPAVIQSVIREKIGFDGILISDDLEMGALDRFGDMGQRADLSLRAGCDLVLHCSGDLCSMEGMMKDMPRISKDSCDRLAKIRRPEPIAPKVAIS